MGLGHNKWESLKPTISQKPVKLSLPLLLPTLLGAAIVPASAVTLVRHDFTHPNPGTVTNLAGTTPNIGPDDGFESWTGHFGFQYTSAGTITNNSAGSGIMASLDMGANYFANNRGIYTLSVDVFFPAGTAGNAVLGLGFSSNTSSAPGESMANATSYGMPWMFLRANGQVAVRSNSSSDNLYTSSGNFASGSIHNLKLILDTSGTNWVVSSFVDSTQLNLTGPDLSYTFPANPDTIRYVGLTTTQVADINGNGVGYYDNFLLTFDAVPEPSSLGLVGLGALGCVLRRRKA